MQVIAASQGQYHITEGHRLSLVVEIELICTIHMSTLWIQKWPGLTYSLCIKGSVFKLEHKMRSTAPRFAARVIDRTVSAKWWKYRIIESRMWMTLVNYLPKVWWRIWQEKITSSAGLNFDLDVCTPNRIETEPVMLPPSVQLSSAVGRQQWPQQRINLETAHSSVQMPRRDDCNLRIW